ncbi:MAG TPA: tRNA (N(6)-L-threonylcarbamoyladenosine(37)-C(2))-methylthiotransferase MtaB [Clostridiales bacterium]|jgi:threonylcarbamoyladenosine tRNA methylthiotransferase MtaB|nr:tRNA (N(6)-L-threonylcarbamoyladenosine(37)-C(2))-methylthiotransferase MtaB [Clostridiales bacterium]
MSVRQTVGIYTLGCKVNQYESQAIAERCEALGILVLPPEEICDAYIINTCTVTGEADRKARQYIRRAISQNPEAKIIVTGCFSQLNPRTVAEIPGVDYICGNTNKLAAAEVAAELLRASQKNQNPEISVSDIKAAGFEPMQIKSFGRTRAFLKIEDGCESNCAYCIIPAARGKIRSKPLAEVVSEVKTLIGAGCHEVVLTGIETAAYGRDLGTDLSSLLEEIDNIEGIGRVRLGSLDPALLRPRFIERISKLRSLAPHFHISIQSGCDRVLALMRRKYNTGMARRALADLRAAFPGVQFTADMIVGFPGETDTDFADTLDFVRWAKFLSIHVFPYSRRPGTAAAQIPEQVPADIKKQRWDELDRLQSTIRRGILDDIVANSPVQEVLFENPEEKEAFGHTASFIGVSVPGPLTDGRPLRHVKLERHDGLICFGSLAD